MSNFMKTNAPPIQLSQNTDTALDLCAGVYKFNPDGEAILNGGIPKIFSIVGPQNGCKTAQMLSLVMTVLNNIPVAGLNIMDTEDSLTHERLNGLSRQFAALRDMDHGDTSMNDTDVRIALTNTGTVTCSEHFEQLREYSRFCNKDMLASAKYTLPIRDKKGGKYPKCPPQQFVFIDTLTNWQPDEILEMRLNGAFGSDQNIIPMREGLAKQNFMTQLSRLCNHGGLSMVLTAHVGKKFEMNRFLNDQGLVFSAAGKSTNKVGNTFERLNSLILEITSLSLLNSSKVIMYPLTEIDKTRLGIDLLLVKCRISRNKRGGSGVKITQLISQSHGLLVHLGAYHSLKTDTKPYGISGKVDYTHWMTLYPSVKLTRKTVRTLIDSDRRLRQAIIYTDQLRLLPTFMSELAERFGQEIWCTPEELYEDMIKKGIDWDIILDCRTWWTYDELANKSPMPLTTINLLQWRLGTYKPAWYDKAVKAKANKAKRDAAKLAKELKIAKDNELAESLEIDEVDDVIEVDTKTVENKG